MSFSHSSLSAHVKSYLTFLPEEIRQKILEHLHGVIHYEPVIGIMGKSGTGKSSLCNAIFQSRICATHPLNGCTRQAHRLTLQIGERRMTLVDLPGIGETPQHDQEYRELYRQLLPDNRENITIRLDGHIQSVQGKERYEDEMFIIKYFKKGSAHITFKRLELIDRINDIIAGTFLLYSQPDPKCDSLSISKGTAGIIEGTFLIKPSKLY